MSYSIELVRGDYRKGEDWLLTVGLGPFYRGGCKIDGGCKRCKWGSSWRGHSGQVES